MRSDVAEFRVDIVDVKGRRFRNVWVGRNRRFSIPVLQHFPTNVGWNLNLQKLVSMDLSA